MGRLVAVALAVLAFGGAAGCGSSGDDGASGDVTVADFSFSPATTTVAQGDTVTWTNEGQTEHTVKGPGFFSSKALAGGDTFEHRFDRAGRFRYVCTLHPSQMRGIVVVEP